MKNSIIIFTASVSILLYEGYLFLRERHKRLKKKKKPYATLMSIANGEDK